MGFMRVDLHMHTTYSDGTLAVNALLQELNAVGVSHFCITDHDSLAAGETILAGLAQSNGRQENTVSGMQFFVGVEINTQADRDMVHILGYGRQLIKSPSFMQKIAAYRAARRRRADLIIEKLNALGIDINLNEVESRSPQTIGRPNIADLLVKKKITRTRTEAFEKYLSSGRPCYVASLGPSPREAIELIAGNGGIAVVAHPGAAHLQEDDILEMVQWGLGGVEAYHPLHSPKEIRLYDDFAGRHGLLITGGSDYHGPGSGYDKFFHYDFKKEMIEQLFDKII